jgi:hypothetical protein
MEDVGMYILWTFGLCYGHLIYYMTFGIFWFYFPPFGTLYQDKSGNPCCRVDDNRRRFLELSAGSLISFC